MLDLEKLMLAVRKEGTPELRAHLEKYGEIIKTEYDALVAAEKAEARSTKTKEG